MKRRSGTKTPLFPFRFLFRESTEMYRRERGKEGRKTLCTVKEIGQVFLNNVKDREALALMILEGLFLLLFFLQQTLNKVTSASAAKHNKLDSCVYNNMKKDPCTVICCFKRESQIDVFAKLAVYLGTLQQGPLM